MKSPLTLSNMVGGCESLETVFYANKQSLHMLPFWMDKVIIEPQTQHSP